MEPAAQHDSDRRRKGGPPSAAAVIAAVSILGGTGVASAGSEFTDTIRLQIDERHPSLLAGEDAASADQIPSGQTFGYYDGSDLKGGMFVGYMDIGEVDFGSSPGADDLDGDAATYGFAAMYDGGTFALESLIGMADASRDDIGMTFYQLGATVSLSSSLELTGQFLDTTFITSDLGNSEFEATSIGIRYLHENGQIFARVGSRSYEEDETTSLFLGMTFSLGAGKRTRPDRREFSSLAF
jgi:hypothetical protein